MQVTTTPAKRLVGEVEIPDLINHISPLYNTGAIADGDTHLSRFLMSSDCLNTIKAFRQMGVNINVPDSNNVTISVGYTGLNRPLHPLMLATRHNCPAFNRFIVWPEL